MRSKNQDKMTKSDISLSLNKTLYLIQIKASLVAIKNEEVINR